MQSLNTPLFDHAVKMRSTSSHSSKPEIEPHENFDAKHAAHSLLHEDFRKIHGAAAPVRVFSILNKHLSIHAGALLVSHYHSGQYIPAAFTGFDSYTQTHLHIPPKILHSLLRKNDAFLLQDQQRKVLQQYMSLPDYKKSTRYVLFPFTYLNNIMAVLLICNSPITTINILALSVMLSAFAHTASELLFNEYKKLTQRWQSAHVVSHTELQSTLQQMNTQHNDKVELIHCNLQPVIHAIQQQYPSITQPNLMSELLAATALLFHNIKTTIHLKDSHLLLAGKKNVDMSPKLAVYILHKALEQIFSFTLDNPLSFDMPSGDSFLRAY